MKALGGTSALTVSVGAPWEINRLTLPVSKGSNRTRVSDFYTKLGGNSGYSVAFALSPDHGIGYSILVAGDTALRARGPLRNIVGEVFLPAAEHGAFENAAKSFAGTFADDTPQGSNLTLTVDDDHPGLGLSSWFENGTEWRANLTMPGTVLPPKNLTVRLYPTGLVEQSTSLSALYLVEGSTRISFRAVPQKLPIAPRAAVEGGKGLFENSCETWESVGFFAANDEFVFELVNGKVQGVKSKMSGTFMKRVD